MCTVDKLPTSTYSFMKKTSWIGLIYLKATEPLQGDRVLFSGVTFLSTRPVGRVK